MTSLVRPRRAFAAVTFSGRLHLRSKRRIAISALIPLALIPFLLFSPVVRGQKGKGQPGAPVVRRLPLSPPTPSFVVRGALIGGDLTDPENNGDPENNVNYNATFNASEEPQFGGSEGAFNVFDNLLGSGSNVKWCCGDQNNFPANPITVDATFASAIVLRRFTVTSANDAPDRDPRVWKIQGSNDGSNFTDIFVQNNPSASLWTARDQVLEFRAGDDYTLPAAYSTIRFLVTATGLTTGARFQLAELEYFDTEAPPDITSFVVNTTADTDDGACTTLGTGNGCTLREAITLANTDPGIETITFDPAVFAAPGPHIIQLTSALPDLSTDIDINGPGARLLSVRGEGASDRYRIFTVTSGVTVNISGLTVTNGHTFDGGTGVNGGEGGGIRNAGTLTLTGVAVSGNRTGNGGSSAASGGIGGGIRNVGTLTITNSTISGNQTGDGGPDPSAVGGPGGTGGGISNALGSLTITNSTISGNQTGNGGSGAISGSRGEGGGIHSGNATLTITGSTITANGASGGGGIRRNGSGVLTLRSTIVAGNSASAGPDIRGDVQSDGYNLVQNTATANINQNSGAGPNITGQDPQLGSLADNGGPTDTHELDPNSPAIDKGKNFATDSGGNPILTDQRGQTRPFDAAKPDAAGGDGSDIGAFEAQATEVDSDGDGTNDDTDTDDDEDGVPDPQDQCLETPPGDVVGASGCIVPFVVNSVDDDPATGSTSDNSCTTGQTVTVGAASVPECTLRAAIQEANGTAGVQTIVFDQNVFGSPGTHTIQLTSALPNLSSDIDIDGPGARILTVRRDSATRFRIFTVTSGVTVNILGLTVTNGHTANGAPAQPGAGIRNAGTLTLTGVAVSGNQTGQGAGCANCTGGNGGDGGGISNDGTLNLVNSTVSGNQAGVGGNGINANGVGGNGGAGGGINNNGTLTITNSTVSGNQTNAGGTGNLGNGGGGPGGGINNNGTLTISNSTITANTANGTGGGIDKNGGTFTIRSTIVAGNTAPAAPDVDGVVQSDGYNLIGEDQASGGFTQPTDLIDVNPLLNPLANNGGPTATHSLQTGSPALDKGKNFATDSGGSPINTDQRGFPRPVNDPAGSVVAPATGGDNSDIGAYELQPVSTVSPGQLIISEFRLSGPGGAADEFVEVYNNTDSLITVQGASGTAGFGLFDANNLRCLIANGVTIPARGHFLCAGAAYTLAASAAPDAAITGTGDIADNVGLALFDRANVISPVVFDAVGPTTETQPVFREGAGYPPLTVAGVDYSLYRDLSAGTPRDTNDNETDFKLVDTQPGVLRCTPTPNFECRRLGAPGPENLSSPVQRNAQVAVVLLDTSAPAPGAPNRTRDFMSDPMNNSTFGTLTIRRRVVNNTGQAVTLLRFRIVTLTTFPAAAAEIADLRALTSADVTVMVNDAAQCSPNPAPCMVAVRGTTLEQPPAQPNGGGLNSSLSVALPTPLAVGASINVQLLLGIQQTGLFRFYINVEALTGEAASPAMVPGGAASSGDAEKREKAKPTLPRPLPTPTPTPKSDIPAGRQHVRSRQ